MIIAACAHTAGMGVLHYDGDYDVLVKHTRLHFQSGSRTKGPSELMSDSKTF